MFSFSINIVKYHKKYPHYKKYIFLKYFTPDRFKRYSKTHNFIGMEYDFYEILNTLEKISIDDINDCVIESIKNDSYEKVFKLNEGIKNFYIDNKS